jgi:ring-1,2-phenylacetyl-CoA epoxidase subunit PaaE
MILSLKVAKIKRETIDTITVCMRQPGLKKIKYKPGQYITLVVHVNGRKYLRPYSFSSCPGIDEFLEITVKRVANGVVSNHINDMIKEGDTLEVMPPMGDFVYNFDKKVNTAYFWGVGSGITPLLSLLKSILYSAYDTKVLLIYGNRERESTIFFKELEDLQNHFQNRFRVIHFNTIFTVNSDNPLLIQGRITEREYTLYMWATRFERVG